MSTIMSAPLSGVAATLARQETHAAAGSESRSILASMRCAAGALFDGYAAYVTYEALRGKGVPAADAAAQALGNQAIVNEVWSA